jgi:hypothetical protein
MSVTGGGSVGQNDRARDDREVSCFVDLHLRIRRKGVQAPCERKEADSFARPIVCRG